MSDSTSWKTERTAGPGGPSPGWWARVTSRLPGLPQPVKVVLTGAAYAVGTALTLRALGVVCGVRYDDSVSTTVMVLSGVAGLAGVIAHALAEIDP